VEGELRAESGVEGAQVNQGVEGDGFALFGPGEALMELVGLSGAVVAPLVGGVEVSLGRLELGCFFEGEDVKHVLGVSGGEGSKFCVKSEGEAVDVRVELAPIDCVLLDEIVDELISCAHAGDPLRGGVSAWAERSCAARRSRSACAAAEATRAMPPRGDCRQRWACSQVGMPWVRKWL
jgi:hypothetical protein